MANVGARKTAVNRSDIADDDETDDAVDSSESDDDSVDNDSHGDCRRWDDNGIWDDDEDSCELM